MKFNLDGVSAQWRKKIAAELSKKYMDDLSQFLDEEIQSGREIFPQGVEYFSAFRHTDFQEIKVVILGQDPYHGPNQAHGLCFSVKPDVPPPRSLVNIYKELKSDLGIPIAKHGYLKSWADQGVFLLNSVLTVAKGQPASHQKQGWEQFTDQMVANLNQREKPMVFMLWGKYAQAKGGLLDRDRHLVLESAHPSPFSANRGFFGCRHFSKANHFLEDHGMEPIEWSLPDRELH